MYDTISEYKYQKAVTALAREMRSSPTPAEEQLWSAVRAHRLGGYHFRRQHCFERFILDFYCASKLVAIEVNGSVHQYTVEEDKVRTKFLEENGIKVLIYSNSQIFDDLQSVLTWILEALSAR